MQTGDVPHLLWEMYEEAMTGAESAENEKYRLALLGLVNAFEADIDRMGLRLPAPLISKGKDPDVS